MFTGIIQTIGRIEAIEALGDDVKLSIQASKLGLADVQEGDSIAVNGVCLTATALNASHFTAHVSKETLLVTVGLGGTNAVNLEHILPINPGPEWKIDVETSAAFHKRIGNMVLLGSAANASIGNGSFREKLPTLKKSPFLVTSEVGKNSKWGPDEIRTRQTKLALDAPKVWPL